MRQAKNEVFIEGILSEIDINYSTFKRNNQDMDAIRGTIKIRVELAPEQILEIPVHLFSPKFTQAGALSKIYEGIETIKNEYNSIAAVGIDKADRVRITRGTLDMNEFVNQSGEISSYPRINARFVNKITDLSRFKPRASFDIEFVIAKIQEELDSEGVETGRLKIMGIVPQYENKVDIFPFYTSLPDAISAIKTNWQENDSVVVTGKVNFSSKTEVTMENLGFGEPIEKIRTTSINELIITGGDPEPLSGEFAFNLEEIQEALSARKARLEALKQRGPNRKSSISVEQAKLDLGF